MKNSDVWLRVIQEAFETIALAEPGHQAYKSLGLAHLRLQMFQAAEAALRNHLRMDPDDPVAKSLLQQSGGI